MDVAEEAPVEVAPPAEAEAPKPKKRAPAKPKAEPARVEEAAVAEEAPAVEAEADVRRSEPVAAPEAEAKPKRRLGAEEEGVDRVAKVKITQVRSQIGQSERHRGTLRALGLGKIGRSVEQEETARCSPGCCARSAIS